MHARWNTAVISALVAGAKKTLLSSGVLETNILVQDVPGSYELPYAVQRFASTSSIAPRDSLDLAMLVKLSNPHHLDYMQHPRFSHPPPVAC